MIQSANTKAWLRAEGGLRLFVGGAKVTKNWTTGRLPPVRAIRIDRRRHLELAWQRQQEEERVLEEQASTSLGQGVLEVRNLRHLDLLLEKAGNSVVVIFFYSKSCGACKQILDSCSRLCSQSQQERANVVFLKHNVYNDFDSPTDVVRMYGIRTVPSFGFFSGGALVRHVRMRDVRGLAGPPDKIQAALRSDQRKLSNTLREVLFRIAPSAAR
eukprot:evm.model.scf_682EXC.7 EVM.evm.TU.scf_682EXC.7   scf_682EXC:35645-39268(-)